jgi:hypothetical protein
MSHLREEREHSFFKRHWVLLPKGPGKPGPLTTTFSDSSRLLEEVVDSLKRELAREGAEVESAARVTAGVVSAVARLELWVAHGPHAEPVLEGVERQVASAKRRVPNVVGVVEVVVELAPAVEVENVLPNVSPVVADD